MESNYFAQAYGVAPPPAAPPPPEQAPPPVEPAPAPSGNYFADTYVAPPPQQAAPQPAPEPQGYIPGSTYVPPAERGTLPAAGAQPSAPAAGPKPTAIPQQPSPQSLEGLIGPERFARERAPAALQGFIPSVTEFMEQPTLMDKAGMVIGAWNMPADYGTRRTSQRAIDLATKGDPDATLGPLTPQGVVEHPENVLDVLPQVTSNLPGGGEEEFNAWVKLHPEKIEEAQGSGDPLLTLYNSWLDETGQSLESGGIGGALKGIGRSAGQDVSILPSVAVAPVASGLAHGAELAGAPVARGLILKGEGAVQTAIDPIGMAVEQGAKKGIGKVSSLFRPTDEVMQAQQTDATREVLRGAVGATRQTQPVMGAAAPSATVPPTNGAVPPAAPVTPPTNGATPPPQTVTPNGATPPPVTVPPNGTPPVQAAPPPQIPVGPGSAPVLAPRNVPTVPRAVPAVSKGGSPNLMRDPQKGWVLTNGERPDVRTLELARREIAAIDPDDMKPFIEGRAVVPGEQEKAAHYLAAMTEQQYALDDWPSARPGPAPKKEAGQRYIGLLGKRIQTFGRKEVDRLVDEFRVTMERDLTPGAAIPANRTQKAYWDNRADAIIEAATKAGYDGSIELQTPTRTHTYTGGGQGVSRSGVAPMRVDDPAFDGTEALAQTLEMFPAGSPAKQSMTNRLTALLGDPDGFSTRNAQHVQTRKNLYKSGAWSKTMAAPITAGDSAETVAKKQAQNAAYARYQAMRDYHEAAFGAAAPETKQQRGGIVGVYGTLSPQQKAIADAVSQEFRAHLDTMGLGHVRLSLVDHIREAGSLRQVDYFAEFDPELQNIDLSVNYTLGNILFDLEQRIGPDWASRVSSQELTQQVQRSLYQSLNHETVHALRQMQVFTPDEWNLLTREANARGYGQWAENQYSDLGSVDALDEEAVAEMFADFALNQKNLTPQTRTLLQRIVDFFAGFIKATAKNDPEGVMKRMLSGEVGSRTPLGDVSDLLPQQRRGPALGKRAALAAMDVDTGHNPTDDIGRALLDPMHERVVRQEIDYQGQPTTLWDAITQTRDDADHLHFLAERNLQSPLSGADKAELDRLTKQFAAYEPRYDWADPNFTPEEIDRIAADHVTDLWSKQKFPPKAPKPPGVADKMLQFNRDLMGLRRVAGLSNPVSMPRQFVVQTLGNLMGFAIAKPKAITGMFNVKDYAKAFRAARTQTELDASAQFFKNMGFATNAAIRPGAKSNVRLAKGMSPGMRSFVDKVAPKWSQDLVATPDAVARGSLSRTAFIPGMRREQKALPKRGSDLAAAYHGKGDFPPIAPQEVADVVSKTLKAHTQRGDPLSRATGAHIEADLKAAFAGRAGVGSAEAKNFENFANRLGRDYNEVRNRQYQLAARETNRVLFSWDNLKIDDVVGNFALYMYWTSRATGLYATELAKKPWMAGAFVRLGQALMDEANENNYPDWMKGYTRFMNSPAGITLLHSPADAFATMLFFNWELGDAANMDMAHLTASDALGLIPAFFGPVVQYGAYLVSPEARPPSNLLGFEPILSKAASFLNLANVNGHLPAGMLRDANNNPVLLDTHVMTSMVQAASNRLFGVAPLDLDAGYKVNRDFFLQDVLREGHPEWADDPEGENQLTRMANQMKEDAELRGIYSPEWLEAEKRAVGLPFTGPDFAGMPGPLQAIFRQISPVRVTAMPESRTMEMYGFGQADRPTVIDPTTGKPVPAPIAIGTTDTYDKGDLKGRSYDTLEMALLEAANEDWFDLGKSSGLQDAVQMYNAIGKGEVGANVKIYDKTYTPEQLELMTKGQRYDLAEEYLASKGFTVADKDQYYADREAIEAAHPDLSGYMEYRDYVNGYPGGAQGFVDAAVRSSPSFARFMAQLPYPPGSEEYYKAALWTDGYYAIEGRRSGVYDPLQLPETGTIPGMGYGETFAQRRALQDAVDAAGSPSSGGGTSSQSSFDDFVADVDKQVANLYYAKKLLDETYPGTGLVPGRDRLPYDMYKTMEGIWEANGVYAPDKGSIELEYYDWLAANATAADHSVKAFINQREDSSPGGAEMPAPTPEEIAAQLGVSLATSTALPPRTAQGRIDTTGMPKATPAMDIEMRTGPNMGNPVSVVLLQGMPLYVAARDGEWVEVVALGGQTGWVPAAALLKAA